MAAACVLLQPSVQTPSVLGTRNKLKTMLKLRCSLCCAGYSIVFYFIIVIHVVKSRFRPANAILMPFLDPSLTPIPPKSHEQMKLQFKVTTSPSAQQQPPKQPRSSTLRSALQLPPLPSNCSCSQPSHSPHNSPQNTPLAS